MNEKIDNILKTIEECLKNQKQINKCLKEIIELMSI